MCHYVRWIFIVGHAARFKHIDNTPEAGLCQLIRIEAVFCRLKDRSCDEVISRSV